MKYNAEPIKNWFGFTRRERRSTFSLLIIIVFILIIRYSIPNSNATVEDLTPAVFESYDHSTHNNDFSKPVEVKDKKAYLQKITGIQNKKFSAARTSYQAGIRQLKKPVDINLSDTSELIRLPGIGSVLSARIVKYRAYLGGYSKIEQLKEVYGLSAETYDLIKNSITADSSFIKRININAADYKELSHVRYLDKYEITAILKYRKLKGNIYKLSDMVDNKLITIVKARKVGAYIRFD
jgi:DNA uptake protein ComE-like DNA-binding protein